MVADAVGGTSTAAHESALRRMEQAGAKLISKTQLYCELQRDWARTETVPGFMDVFQNWDGSNPEKDFKDNIAKTGLRFRDELSYLFPLIFQLILLLRNKMHVVIDSLRK